MFLFKKIYPLQQYLATVSDRRGSIGFVPTMGALHQGHLALVAEALQHHECVVCSIFVNPTQFNDEQDLEKYPRTPEKDIELLEKVGCHVLFMPEVSEVYPSGQNDMPDFNFGDLDKVMEGAFRPGHFVGVAQVVHRLLQIVQPDSLYMGQKDYQQTVVVQKLLEQVNAPVQLSVQETIREADGLAMSSRNVRLAPELRERASIIYETLRQARDMAERHESPHAIRAFAMKNLDIPGFKPEYFEIVNGKTLQPLAHLNGAEKVVACTAVWAGDVRLIDNMILK